MADGGGALEAQQRFAAEEPYKNIALGNPAEQFLNAWGVATQLKLKRQEIQGKMQALVNRNAQLEFMDHFKEESFGRNLALKQAQLENMAYSHSVLDAYRAAELGLQNKRIGIAEDRLADNEQLKSNQQEAQAGLGDIPVQLANEGLRQGSREWKQRYNQLASQYIGKLPASEFNAWQKRVLDNQNLTIYQEQRNAKMARDGFLEKMGAEVYGNPKIQGLAPILNPEKLDDETKKEHWYQKEWSTGRKKIYVVDPTTGHKTAVNAMDPKRLTQLNAEWQKIVKSQQEVADPTIDPQLGVFPPANTLRQRMLQAQQDPNASAAAKAAAEQWLKDNP